MTRDTTQGLDFLDLTLSDGLSRSYVSSRFGVGFEFQGLRYATNQEVVDLVNDWGFSPGARSGVNVDGPSGTNQLGGLVTLLGGDYNTAFGANVAAGMTTTQAASIINWPTLAGDSVYWGAFNAIENRPWAGSFLVRSSPAQPPVTPTPEPATLAIWGGLGLVGLVAARRRKKLAV